MITVIQAETPSTNIIAGDNSRIETKISLQTVGLVTAIGRQGLPRRDGESLLGGYELIVNGQLKPGDHIEFSGTSWVNTQKTTLTDGGNF